MRQLQADQHRADGEQPGQRNGEGGEQHQQRQFPHAVLFQTDRAAEQAGRLVHAEGADRQQHGRRRRWPASTSAAQCSASGIVKRFVMGVPQHGVAAQAQRARAGRHGGHDLDLAAVAALPQVGSGGSGLLSCVGGDEAKAGIMRWRRPER